MRMVYVPLARIGSKDHGTNRMRRLRRWLLPRCPRLLVRNVGAGLLILAGFAFLLVMLSVPSGVPAEGTVAFDPDELTE